MSEDFLSGSYAQDKAKDTLRYEQAERTRFSVEFAPERRSVNTSSFALRAFNLNAEGKQEDFLTTKDQEFIMMTHYQQLTFEVKSQRLMGWGDRNSESLFMKEGNFTVFPNSPNAQKALS